MEFWTAVSNLETIRFDQLFQKSFTSGLLQISIFQVEISAKAIPWPVYIAYGSKTLFLDWTGQSCGFSMQAVSIKKATTGQYALRSHNVTRSNSNPHF